MLVVCSVVFAVAGFPLPGCDLAVIDGCLGAESNQYVLDRRRFGSGLGFRIDGGTAENRRSVVPVLQSAFVKCEASTPATTPIVNHKSSRVFLPFTRPLAQVNDGTVEKLFLEDGTGYTDVSSGDTVLAAL